MAEGNDLELCFGVTGVVGFDFAGCGVCVIGGCSFHCEGLFVGLDVSVG